MARKMFAASKFYVYIFGQARKKWRFFCERKKTETLEFYEAYRHISLLSTENEENEAKKDLVEWSQISNNFFVV